jgi:hypothetical protein
MTLARAAEWAGILAVAGASGRWIVRQWRSHRPAGWFRKRMVLIVLPDQCQWGLHIPSGSAWLRARLHVGNTHLGDDFARAYLRRPRAEGSVHWLTPDQVDLSVVFRATVNKEPGKPIRGRLVLIDNRNRHYSARVRFTWTVG